MKVNTTSYEYIVNKYKGLVYKLAKRLKTNKSDFDDLVQAGFMGLLTASSKFDFTKNTNFISYASVYIISEMKKENQKISIYKTSDYIRKLKSKVEKLENKSVNEIAEILNTSIENILMVKNLQNNVVSLNDIEEILPSPKIEFIELDLTKEELMLYKMKYVNKLTQFEIGERLNLSQPTVSRKLSELKKKIIDLELYK